MAGAQDGHRVVKIATRDTRIRSASGFWWWPQVMVLKYLDHDAPPRPYKVGRDSAAKPQNGSNNEPMSPTTNLECPHEGPGVDVRGDEAHIRQSEPDIRQPEPDVRQSEPDIAVWWGLHHTAMKAFSPESGRLSVMLSVGSPPCFSGAA